MTTEAQIINIINSSLNREPLINDSDLPKTIKDLEIDSLDFMLILVKIQEDLGVSISETEAAKIDRIADLVEIVKSSK